VTLFVKRSSLVFFSQNNMKKIVFTKMVATGNDFVVSYIKGSSAELRKLAKATCDRKFGVGADGLLALEKSRVADVRMRVFNADGSEAEMCGNGARCIAAFIGKPEVRIQTLAGIIESKVKRDIVKIKLTNPSCLKLELPIRISNRTLRVNFINTGVPHAVIFVEGLDKIDVKNLGRQIRFHKQFAPAGTNVNFVEVLKRDSIKVRTYERGVEDETLACGTGSVASALITSYMLQAPGQKMINVLTKSGEVLKVSFRESDNKFKEVWLEGKVKVVFNGAF